MPPGSVISPLLFLLYINGPPAALDDSAFLFADDLKMVFPRTQPCSLLLYLSSAWAWTGEWDLAINPKKCSCLTVGNLPPLSLSFSAVDANHQTPEVTLTRLSPRKCTAESLRIQQCDGFSRSEDPSANYPKQRLSRCTVSLCSHTWYMQWKPTPQH